MEIDCVRRENWKEILINKISSFPVLKDQSVIQDLFQKGQRKRSAGFQIIYDDRPGIQGVLYCTDKSCKTKVNRNRIKRILKEMFRDFLSNETLPLIRIALMGRWELNQIPHSERLLNMDKAIKDIIKRKYTL
jgi:ribonuclease P protein component